MPSGRTVYTERYAAAEKQSEKSYKIIQIPYIIYADVSAWIPSHDEPMRRRAAYMQCSEIDSFCRRINVIPGVVVSGHYWEFEKKVYKSMSYVVEWVPGRTLRALAKYVLDWGIILKK